MAKHDLPERRPTFDLELATESTSSTYVMESPEVLTLPNGDQWSLRPQDISNLVQCGIHVLQELVSIKRMEVETESSIRRIDAETRNFQDRLGSVMKKDRQDADIWSEQFDKKRRLILDLLEFLSKNPGHSAADLATLVEHLKLHERS